MYLLLVYIYICMLWCLRHKSKNVSSVVCFLRSLCFIIVSSVGVWFGEFFDNFAFFILKEFAVDIH